MAEISAAASSEKGPQAGGTRKAGRSKSPRRNNNSQQGKGKGKSKSPGPRRNQQGKSKSPVRQNKGKSKSPARKQQPKKPVVPETPPPARANDMTVDSLFLSMSGYSHYRSMSGSDAMLSALPSTAKQSAMTTPKNDQNQAPEVPASMKQLPEAFQCDPFLASIAVKANLAESVNNHKSRGRQEERNGESGNNNARKSTAANQKSISPVPQGRKGRSKSPKKKNQKQQQQQQEQKTQADKPKNQAGRSKSPKRKQKARSKSPKGGNKAKQSNGIKDNGSSASTTITSTTSGMAKFLPHVQVDPCFVGMAAAMCAPKSSTLGMTINVDGRLGVLSLGLPTMKQAQSTSATKSGTNKEVVIPPTFMEVEPLMSQMVPDELTDAINLEMSKTLEEREATAAFPEESFMSPAKPSAPATQTNGSSKNRQTPAAANNAVVDQTPPTNLAGKVSFFEKLMRQKLERPTVDPKVKVKAAVSEKVKSVHAQVRTSLVATKKGKPATGWELPEGITPVAQKRERVETFFEKEDDAPLVKPPSQNKSTTSNWAKVETAPPSTFEPQPDDNNSKDESKKEVETLEPSPKVDDLVTAMEKKTTETAKPKKAPNGGKENNQNDNGGKQAQQQKSKKARSKSPRRKKSKSPARQKQQKVAAPEPVSAPELEDAEEEPAAPRSTPEPPAASASEQQASPEPESGTAATEKAPPAKEDGKGENGGTGKEDSKQKKGRKGRSRSPRKKQSKSKSPVRQEPKKAPEAVATPELEEPKEDMAADSPAPAPTPAPVEPKEELKAAPEMPESPVEAPAPETEEVTKAEEVKDEEKAGNDAEEAPVVEEITNEAEKENEVLTHSDKAVPREEVVEGDAAQDESVYRDVAAEVLDDSEAPKSPTRSPKRSPMRSKADTPYSSYAQALAKGKKQEQKNVFSPPKSGGRSSDVASPAEVPRVTSDIDELIARVLGKPTPTKVKASPEAKPKAEEPSTSSDSEANANDTEMAKMEEMALRLAEASPQKKVDPIPDESVSSVEMTSEFKDIVKRKKVAEDEMRGKPRVLFEQSVQGAVDSESPTAPVSAIKKANFNPYDVLDMGETPGNDENATPKKSKKGKTKSPKSDGMTDSSNEENRTPKHSKKGKSKTPKASASPKKKRSVRFEAAPDADKFLPNAEAVGKQQSPPLLAMPLHMINTIAHTKPLSYVLEGVFWICVLVIGFPIGATMVLLSSIYRLFCFFVKLLGIGLINPKQNPEQQLGVVITGCDTGFGHDLAVSLMNQGFVVFCCCLRKDSLKSFEGEDLAIPVLMDVTKDSDVEKASKLVENWLSGADGRYLHALVNNAGVGYPGLIDWLPVGDFQRMMDVNYFGMVRCCKKFLPLFRFQSSSGFYSDARIVNMVSTAGLVSGGMFSVAYEASKHAAEVFTTNLRLESRAFNLQVTVLNPTFHKTPMTKVMSENMRKVWKTLPAEKRKEYGEEYLNDACEVSDFATNVMSWKSYHVVRAMEQSVSYKKAPVRLLIGSDAKYLFAVVHMLPTWFVTPFNKMKLDLVLPAIMEKTE